MPKYINPEKIKLNTLSWVDGGEDILVPLIDVKKAIALTPAEEDVIKVVRCGECRFKVVNKDGKYNPHDIVCDHHDVEGLDEKDYCSFGERINHEK